VIASFLAFGAILAAACTSSGGREAPPATETPGPLQVATAPPAPSVAPPVLSPTPSSVPGRFTINAVGDLMLARDITDLMDARGSVYPFERVRPLLADADLTIANMEGTFTERGAAAEKFYTFRTPPRHAKGLAEAGIDLVSLGNNHTMDFGADGLADTIAALDAAGVKHAGAGANEQAARAPVMLDVKGVKVALLSYNAVLEATFARGGSPGVAYADPAAVRADVASARAQADIVIVALHGGTEYTDTPTAEQRNLAHTAIDAGAALVLGAHPHVLQGWERYKNGFIAYSLGNFVFDLDRDDLATLGPRPFQTMVLHLELDRTGVVGATYRPVYIDPDEDRPRPATADEAAAIQKRVEMLNRLLP
jgi:poly-gamma-glutamate capsule biosynthesis protein CapA/YwtB (metallophosphatase superfamily)